MDAGHFKCHVSFDDHLRVPRRPPMALGFLNCHTALRDSFRMLSLRLSTQADR